MNDEYRLQHMYCAFSAILECLAFFGSTSGQSCRSETESARTYTAIIKPLDRWFLKKLEESPLNKG